MAQLVLACNKLLLIGSNCPPSGNSFELCTFEKAGKQITFCIPCEVDVTIPTPVETEPCFADPTWDTNCNLYGGTFSLPYNGACQYGDNFPDYITCESSSSYGVVLTLEADPAPPPGTENDVRVNLRIDAGTAFPNPGMNSTWREMLWTATDPGECLEIDLRGQSGSLPIDFSFAICQTGADAQYAFGA